MKNEVEIHESERERMVTNIGDGGVVEVMVVLVVLWEQRCQPESMSTSSSRAQQVRSLNVDPAHAQTPENEVSSECFCNILSLEQR